MAWLFRERAEPAGLEPLASVPYAKRTPPVKFSCVLRSSAPQKDAEARLSGAEAKLREQVKGG